MRIRFLRTFAVCGLVLTMALPVAAGPTGSSRDQASPRSRQADLPTNRPIVATVVEVDQDAGRVTLDTEHGQVALSVSEDVAERLNPGDVVVLRLTEDDADDAPSASPREELTPSAPSPRDETLRRSTI